MADFVVGDQTLLCAVLKRSSRQPHGDAFQRTLQMLIRDGAVPMSRSENRCFIEQIGQIRP